MKQYSFKELEPQITKALKKLDKENYFGENRALIVLDGFVTVPVQSTIGGGEGIIFGRNLPMVAVIDNGNGRIWYFSLKQLVPSVEFE